MMNAEEPKRQTRAISGILSYYRKFPKTPCISINMMNALTDEEMGNKLTQHFTRTFQQGSDTEDFKRSESPEFPETDVASQSDEEIVAKEYETDSEEEETMTPEPTKATEVTQTYMVMTTFF